MWVKGRWLEAIKAKSRRWAPGEGRLWSAGHISGAERKPAALRDSQHLLINSCGLSQWQKAST